MPDRDDDDRADDASLDTGSGLPPGSLPDSVALELLGVEGGPRLGGKAGKGRRPPQPSEDARIAAQAYLDRQSRMLDIQMEHMHEQRSLVLSHLRLRRLSEAFRVALQTLAILLGGAIVLAIGAMAFEAWRSDSLVIEPFRTPPDLAQRGLDGISLSAQLLDKLRAMQTATDSARAASSYTNNWGEDIKLEIPSTGVSVGELQRYLRRWLGHETHISGEVFRTTATPASPAGLSLTVRAGDQPGETVQGQEPALDAMMQMAAETLFARTQPYRYAVYLARHDRVDQAEKVIAGLAATASQGERAWANEYWGAVLVTRSGDVGAGAAKEQFALSLDPDLVMAHDNLAGDQTVLGHDQEALSQLQAESEVLTSNRARQLTHAVRPVLLAWSKAREAEALGDYGAGAEQAKAVLQLEDFEGIAQAALRNQAAATALRHEVSASRQLLAAAGPRDPAASFAQVSGWGSDLLPELAQDRAMDDWAGAVRDLTAAEASAPSFPVGRASLKTSIQPWLAYALARTGDVAGAEALIAATPLDCYACLRLRGKIAAERHDWAGAERWFAEAVRQAPELPFAHADWGEMLLAKGDARAAAARFADAHARGPHYADAQELWGETLMRAGDFGGAADKLEKAAADAPHWGRLHLRWGQALARLGHARQAETQYAAASGMDLSPADRAELGRLRHTP